MTLTASSWVTRVACAALLAVALTSDCRRDARTLTIATTTSVDNSGLLAYLAPIVKRDTGVELRWIAVGSGKAIQMALDRRVIAAITHDAEAEKRLLASGQVKLYRQFMRNDFIIVGPASNPAQLEASDDAVRAFTKIVRSGSRFCSRSDESGTHSRESKIWNAAGIDPHSPRYYPLGQSMSALLRSSSELGAYTLTDLATFHQLDGSVELREFVSGGPMLQNPYAVAVMKVDRDDDEARNASLFASWLLSKRGTEAIGAFRIRGVQQFFPLTRAQ
jgi:ABC-type tungstate transport system, permease component